MGGRMTKAPTREYPMPMKEVSPALLNRECSEKTITPKPISVDAAAMKTVIRIKARFGWVLSV